MRDARRQAEPGMHRLFPDRVARRREGVDIEGADRDTADRWVAVALPIEIAAAIRAEMKADLVAAVGDAREDVALALEPDALLQIGRAEMEGSAGAPPAGLAVAEIDALRLAGRDNLEPTAMALRPPLCRLLLHRTGPPGLRVYPCRPLLPNAAEAVERVDIAWQCEA